MSKLLLITFIDFGEMKSGSSVRPQRIYEAFQKAGFEVELLSGLQKHMRKRWGRVFHEFLRIRRNLPDFCYVEPPSGPFFNFCDHLLLIYLKARKVPIGLFYRDAYWKLPERWHIKRAKRFFLTLMHRFDLFVFRHTCKIVYFPTPSMAEMFNLPHKGLLPPAGNDIVLPPHDFSGRALYVGGLSLFYGTEMMLRAFDRLNGSMNRKISLTVVCREKEMGDYFKPYQNAAWLNVVHASGDEALLPFYENSDFALYPSRSDIFVDFCMPIKLFEYLSRGLPVVVTKNSETASFVEKNGIGAVSECSAESLADTIASLCTDPARLAAYRENAVKALRGGNLWKHRVDQIYRDLMQK